MDIIAKIEKLKSERGWTDYELAQFFLEDEQIEVLSEQEKSLL